MLERVRIIEALSAYRVYLQKQGKTAKAAAVAHCILIVKRL